MHVLSEVLIVCLLVVLCHFVAGENQGNSTVPRPQVYYLHVNSDIRFRYARTVISSRIANSASISQEVFFTAVLPETAFISGFTIELDGKEYNAYVREKEEAKQEYTEAVRSGRTAAHVALNARDSNRFTVSVNVEPQKKVTFKLTYEELLTRKLGVYNHVINLDPGQIVQDLSVQVNIEESTDISTVKVPVLRISNEINEESESESTNPLAIIERPTSKSVIVKFSPTTDQQRDLASEGIKGQLIVEYDVDRTTNSGEVLVNDGYFVHFFSPTNLPPLKKHVTFVLDVSGSMTGRKVEQLRQAMTTILDDLNRNDLFSIVLFSDTAQVWDPALNSTEMKERMSKLQDHYSWGYPLREYQEVETQNQTLSNSVIVTATLDHVSKAKEFVGHLEALSSTNMYDALMKALEITELGRKLVENSVENNELYHQTPEPIIIFLTDGQPNRDNNIILTNVTKQNIRKYSIFTLALGNDADLSFLKKLSLRNSGFARKIYEASDTALQLRNFYREVASPLLSNITFKYQTEEEKPQIITKHQFRRVFLGSELVVAGKLEASNLTIRVEGSSSTGSTMYPFFPKFCPMPPLLPELSNRTVSSMERLWAYLTIQQLLEDSEAKDNSNDDRNQTSEKQHALELALQYSFVTSLTSLVVVKPNETRSVGTEDASRPSFDPNQGPWALPFVGGPAMMAQSRVAYGSNYMANAPSAFIARPAAMPGPLYAPAPIPPPPPPQGYYGAGVPGSGSVLGGTGTGSVPQSPGIPYPGIGVVPYPSIGVSGPGFGAPPPPPVGTHGAPGTFGIIAPISLIPLSQVLWLPADFNNTITLNFGFNTSALDLQVAGYDQPNNPHQTCSGPVGLGHCRHLRYCALDIFASNQADYQQYFCQIQEYAGVCCPHHIGSASSLPGILAPNRAPNNIALVPLGNLTWLPNTNSLSLPSGIGGTIEDLQVADSSELNLTYGTCISSAGLGFCRHLRHCPMDVFVNSQSEFYPQYFCRIPGNFVGVCCPLSLQW